MLPNDQEILELMREAQQRRLAIKAQASWHLPNKAWVYITEPVLKVPDQINIQAGGTHSCDVITAIDITTEMPVNVTIHHLGQVAIDHVPLHHLAGLNGRTIELPDGILILPGDNLLIRLEPEVDGVGEAKVGTLRYRVPAVA